MWTPHASVGLAQSIFYLPIIPATALLLFRRHGSPKMAWLALFTFSIVRFIGGILYVVYTYNPSQVGWIIVAFIFEGAGVIPLLLVLVGLVRLIHALDFPTNEVGRKSIAFLRVLFLVGIGLLIAGSSLTGNYNDASLLKVGLDLAKAGYIIFVFVLAFLVAGAGLFWAKSKMLCADSKKILVALFCSFPFLAVRMAFACLSVFNSNPKWSILVGGDVAALVCMHSLMEYCVVLICVVCGHLIQPTKKPSGKEGLGGGHVEEGRV